MEDLSRDQAMRILVDGEFAHLGVVSNGEPYVTPISYVVLDDALAFRTGPGRRMDAIRANPRVSVVTTDYDSASGGWRSAMMWGTASIIENSDRKQEAVDALLKKYRDIIGSPLSFSAFEPLAGFTFVVCVSMDEVTGRTSGGGFSPTLRPGRL
ncbi:MAG: pyridoxamine 5'-phosphate oxidase family protein [Acidimicrobiia bacterium]|nr:pyridoxamine 5'-phosphate oxidase family protein [Acidimicrobiia bacterium]